MQIQFSLATTEQSQKYDDKLLARADPQIETQATERLYKDAPPETLRFIPNLYLKTLTTFNKTLKPLANFHLPKMILLLR